MMPSTVLSHPLERIRRRIAADLIRPQRGAMANALAAVHRDRRSAARRAAAERPGDLETAMTLLAVDVG
jgi:hypothetical protein